MTFAPPTLKRLMAYWVAQGGVNLGIVGDTSHMAKGTSYHLGKDDLAAGAYSARLPRDVKGLSNAASAVDLGRLDGTLAALREFSRWFAGECSKGNPAYRDVREVIFWSTARDRVLGWSSEAPGDGWVNDYGDLSHKTHTHISFFRDSEFREKVPMFERYPGFAPLTIGDDMPTPSQYLPGSNAVIKATSNIRSAPALTGTLIRNITADETWTDCLGYVKGGTDTDGACTTDQWLTRWFNGKWEYTSKCNVKSGPTLDSNAPATDCAPVVKAATDPLNAQIATLKGQVATAEITGAQKEWDRQAAGASVAVKLLDRPK